MSQKVRIERVTVTGATPFLGLSDNDDPTSERLYSRNGDTVMEWLASAWRTRYNALRSRRCTYDAEKNLVPIGGTPDTRTTKQARETQSWLTAVPGYILESPQKIENQDWFAAIKRRKTLTSRGSKGGKLPRFRSRLRDDKIFVCWFNGGRNARFHKVGRKHGIVSITGMNPARYRQPGKEARFTIRIHVRVSQEIRPYTSVRVNWTRKELVFVNTPAPIDRTQTGAVVGIDRGVAHTIATSDGHFHDLPADKLQAIDRDIRALQKQQSRAVKVSGHANMRTYIAAGPSKRFLGRAKAIRRKHAQAARIVTHWQHTTTTALVREYDAIVAEKLTLAHMVRAPKPVPDPARPGMFLPNGRASKRGLNRVLHGAALGRISKMLAYKTQLAGVTYIEVNPAYTSQQCHECGHTARKNRKSQAVFLCQKCGHADNADTNAALNILSAGLNPRGGRIPSVESTSDSFPPGSPGGVGRLDEARTSCGTVPQGIPLL